MRTLTFLHSDQPPGRNKKERRFAWLTVPESLFCGDGKGMGEGISMFTAESLQHRPGSLFSPARSHLSDLQNILHLGESKGSEP